MKNFAIGVLSTIGLLYMLKKPILYKILDNSCDKELVYYGVAHFEEIDGKNQMVITSINDHQACFKNRAGLFIAPVDYGKKA